MKTWNYKDYDQYLTAQKSRRDLKKEKKRSKSSYLSHLSNFFEIIDKNEIKSIVCQGVRNSHEVKVFKEIFPNTEVFGTDVKHSDTSENIIQCDFTDLPKDWNKKFDLLYSNSVDHCFDVEKTLEEWIRVTKKYMIIYFSFVEPSETDCSQFDNDQDLELFLNKNKKVKILSLKEGLCVLEIL